MPSPRSAHDLLRLLRAVESPVYFVTEDRKIAFANEACAKWLGISASELHGRVCRYQSGDADPLAAAADALCPPPEVFHGKRTSSVILAVNDAGATIRRRAEFIPLLDNGDVVGVMAIVDANELANNGADDGSTGSSCGEPADEAARLHELVQEFRSEMAGRHRLERLAGKTPAMQRVRAQIAVAAGSRATVLIVGPAGSGKQHVAGTIHFAQALPVGALVPISCSALPAELLLSTISALAKKQSAASDEPAATLLLTDVQQMPAEVQSDVANWLTEGPRNLRVVATSTQPLSPLVEEGTFRADLAALLGTLIIELPSLCVRRSDIPLVAQMLLEDCNGQCKLKQLRGIAADAMDRLSAYDWPGEIDELAKVVQEAFAVAEGYEITSADLPKRLRIAAEAARHPRPAAEPINLEAFLARVETQLIERAIKQSKGNKSQAAKLLGLTRPRLYRRMVQLGLAGEGDH